MKTAKFVKGIEGVPSKWVCLCGSRLEASYNVLNKRDCPDEERVCAWCFKKRGRE